MKILFVCRGNVSRSQMSEALLKKISGNKYEVISAGTKLSGPEQPIHELGHGIENTINVMKEEGVDISNNIRKNITQEMADTADKIILVVDERDPLPDYLINNPKVTRWDVLDTKDQSLDFTRKAKDQIKVLIKNLIEELG